MFHIQYTLCVTRLRDNVVATRQRALYFITGWRRLIGSPKLQIIFHKRATKYRSLLRKMTYKDKGSNESSPPCRGLCKQHRIYMYYTQHTTYIMHIYAYSLYVTRLTDNMVARRERALYYITSLCKRHGIHMNYI